MAGAASQAGDADSSRAPGLTSGLQGSVNVHRGALLLVPQWRCISSFVFYIYLTCYGYVLNCNGREIVWCWNLHSTTTTSIERDIKLVPLDAYYNCDYERHLHFTFNYFIETYFKSQVTQGRYIFTKVVLAWRSWLQISKRDNPSWRTSHCRLSGVADTKWLSLETSETVQGAYGICKDVYGVMGRTEHCFQKQWLLWQD